MRVKANRGWSKRVIQLCLAVSFTLSLVLLTITAQVSAAQITGRTLTIGSSVASASTTYTLTFTVPTTGTVIKSFAADICTTASGTCTTPSGFDNSAASLSSQPTNLGDASGWTVNDSTAGSLRIVKSGDSANPSGSQTVVFGNVTNPSATNSTYFARLTTYSDAGWTTAIDTGTVAAATAGQITVTATVNETLTFTLASATVALGTLSTGSTGSGTSTMTAATNGTSGYAITVNGTTLTSGLNTITAMGTQSTNGSATTSATNTSQFGLNLRSNATPAIGSDVSGSGSGTYGTNYGIANNFRFFTGDTVATASGPTNSNTFTVSYIANIAGSTLPGNYSTTLTYIATATF